MRTILQNIKSYFSTILGIILVTTAVLSYVGAQFFSLVPEHSIYVDLIAACIGFVLVFTSPSKIASDLFEILKNKLNNK